MLPPKSLPARAFEIAHIYRKGVLFEAQVRLVTVTSLLPFARCEGIDSYDDEFRADLDVFYVTRAEAEAAASADMAKFLPA